MYKIYFSNEPNNKVGGKKAHHTNVDNIVCLYINNFNYSH